MKNRAAVSDRDVEHEVSGHSGAQEAASVEHQLTGPSICVEAFLAVEPAAQESAMPSATGRVAKNHGEVKRGPDDHVDLVDRLGSEAAPVVPAGGGELLVEPVEVIGAEAAERHVTDGGVDVVGDEP